jgi:hypothetical protein
MPTRKSLLLMLAAYGRTLDFLQARGYKTR